MPEPEREINPFQAARGKPRPYYGAVCSLARRREPIWPVSTAQLKQRGYGGVVATAWDRVVRLASTFASANPEATVDRCRRTGFLWRAGYFSPSAPISEDERFPASPGSSVETEYLIQHSWDR